MIVEPVCRQARPEDYEAVYRLWMDSGGIGVTSLEDSKEYFERFLQRNQATCFTAEADGRPVGIILCGNDGRSGHIYHLIVDPAFRGRGLARRLLQLSLEALRADGIGGADAVVFRENPANDFWEQEGFRDRPDLTYRDIPLKQDNVWMNRNKRPGDYPKL
ncbi:MAG: GNAT family N-acetyltransferase [Methanomethylophilus sp.]